MAPLLNHTIVWCRDKRVSAPYLAQLLGLPEPKAWGPFFEVELGNEVILAYHDAGERERPISSQHYAFLVLEEEFEAAFGRIEERGEQYWADPGLTRPGEINHDDGGRGVYFHDPDGHLLELITRPYGSGS